MEGSVELIQRYNRLCMSRFPDFRDLLRDTINEKTGCRLLDALPIGKYMLSIQASKYHYSIPRETFDNLYDYEAFEIGLLNETYDLTDMTKIHSFKAWEDYAEFKEYYDGMVAGYVPVKMVQSLMNYMKNQEAYKAWM